MRILVINQFADNKGDRAVLHELLQLVFNTVPDATVTVSTTRPDTWMGESFGGRVDTQRVNFVSWAWTHPVNRVLGRIAGSVFSRYVYPAFARAASERSKLPLLCALMLNRRMRKAISTADLIISTGGHHFTNWFARTGESPLFLDLGLCVMSGKPVCLWSQTIGPLDFSIPRYQELVYDLLCRVKVICVRDGNSLPELQKAGVMPHATHETLESVFAYDAGKLAPPSKRPRRVGISIYTGPDREAITPEKYTTIIADYISYAVGRGYEVCFFPMQIGGRPGDDRPLIRQIIERSGVTGGAVLIDADLPTHEHVKEVANCAIYLAHKTHSIVFALATGTPTVAIAYHPKSSDFMALYGLEDYCRPEEEINAEWLVERHDRLEEIGDGIFTSQNETTERVAARIRNDFAEMLRCASDRIGER